MESMKVAVVVTTIGVPDLLLAYADNALRNDHGAVEFVVIGDLKTPHDAARKVIEQIRRVGFSAEYWDIPMQQEWMRRFPGLEEMIPHNSDNRRNVGFLLALERGAQNIIALDDDNYAVEGTDFFGAHSIVGRSVEATAVSSSNGWFNPCQLLRLEPEVRIYSRGYPFGKRWQDEVRFGEGGGRVVVNMGLWVGDPDVDAVTRLALPVKSLGLQTERTILLQDCYMPINSQNTAVHRDAMPTFYFVPQAVRIDGMLMDRYGDIWAGFFLNKAVSHMGDKIAVGPPVVDHRRNKHDLLRDLQNEFWGMLITEYLVPHIAEMSLSANTYLGTYQEIAENLRGISIHHHPAVTEYIARLSSSMEKWTKVCEQLMT